MDSTPVLGEWWLAGSPEAKFVGMLSFSIQGPSELRIVGWLGGPWMNPPVYEVVLGIADGHRFTLFDCMTRKATEDSFGERAQILHPWILLVGAHVASHADLKIASAIAECDYLHEWCEKSGVAVHEPENADDRKLVVHYQTPPSIAATLGNMSLSIDFRARFPAFGRSSLNIEEETLARMTFAAPVSLHDLLENHIRPLRHIVSLAAGRLSRLRNLSVTLPIAAEGAASPASARVVFASITTETPPALERHDFLFRLRDVSDGFEARLSNWYDLHEVMRPIMNLFFSIADNDGALLEEQFLFVAQVAESYHRRKFGGAILDAAIFRSLYDSVASTIAAQRIEKSKRDALLGKLSWWNETTLRSRLKDLMRLQEVPISKLVGNTKMFIDLVVDTRNYVTHYTPELKEKAADGQDLFILGRSVRALVEFLLLSELGFHPLPIEAKASYHTRYYGIRQHYGIG